MVVNSTIIYVKGTIEEVTTFEYLGSTKTNNGKIDAHITNEKKSDLFLQFANTNIWKKTGQTDTANRNLLLFFIEY